MPPAPSKYFCTRNECCSVWIDPAIMMPFAGFLAAGVSEGSFYRVGHVATSAGPVGAAHLYAQLDVQPEFTLVGATVAGCGCKTSTELVDTRPSMSLFTCRPRAS